MSEGTPNAGGGRWRDGVAVGATFAVLLAVYVATLCPTVYKSDSAELITAIHVLGVPHPTGYPLYMLLGRLMEAILPFGEVAYRLNLASAIFAAAGGALICWAIMLAGLSRPAGVLGGLSGGLFATVWSESLYAEVYSLNMLLVALALVAFCRWRLARTPRSVVWLAAAAGLGLTHHRTAVFVTGPLLITALLLHRPVGWRLLLKAGAAFVAPLALYAYLPLRAAANPPANWGATDTWAGFWHHVSGALYAPYVFARRGDALRQWLGQALHVTRMQIGWVGLLFGLLGGAWMIAAPVGRTLTQPLPERERGSRDLGICLALGFALTLVWSATYAAGDASVFVIPCYLILGWWLAEAAHGVGRTLSGGTPGSRRLARAGAWVAPALMILLPARLVTGNWNGAKKSDPWLADEWAKTVFAQFRPGALALLTGDPANGVAQYFQVVKGERRDVLILSADHANHGWYARRIADARLRGVVLRTIEGWRRATIENLGTWQGTLAYAIATQYPERLPMHTNFPLPQMPEGFWVEERVRLWTVTSTPPRLLADDGGATVQARFPAGIALLGARAGEGALRRGQAAPIWLSWRCQQPVEQRVLAMVDLARRNEGGLARGQQESSVTTPLVFGLIPLAPTPPGRHYAQDVWVVPPRELMPGRYLILVGLEGAGWRATAQTAGQVEVR